MSPPVADFQSSSSSTHLPIFQNPNLTSQDHRIDLDNLDDGLNLMSSSKLEFNCSNDAAPAAPSPIRSSRRKHLKVKKQSSCRESVSTKPVIGTDDIMSFVFNANTGGSASRSSLGQTEHGERQRVDESVNWNNFGFALGATDNNKLSKNSGSEDFRNSGNEFGFSSNFNFVFGKDGKKENRKVSEMGASEFGELKGMDFVFATNMSNGVTTSNSSNGRHGHGYDGVASHVNKNESGGAEGRSCVDGSVKLNGMAGDVDSVLLNRILSLNLETRGLGEKVGSFINESQKGEENNKSDCRTYENLDFVFSAKHKDIKADSNFPKEEPKEKVGKSVSKGREDVTLDAGGVFSTLDADSMCVNDQTHFRSSCSSNKLDSNRNTENSDVFGCGGLKATPNCKEFNDTGFAFGVGSHGARSAEDLGNIGLRTSNGKVNISDDVKRKVDSKTMNILKSEEAENFCDYLKKTDNHRNDTLDDKYKFVFGCSKLGSVFGESSLFEVSNDSRTSSIHGPTNASATNNMKEFESYSCNKSNNLFEFGSNKGHVSSSGRFPTTSFNQHKTANLAGIWSGKVGQKIDEVHKVPTYEFNEKGGNVTQVHASTNAETPAGSDGVGVPNGNLKSSGSYRKDNQPINQNDKSLDGDQYFGTQSNRDAEVNKDSCSWSSSTTGLGFVPKTGSSEATPTNRVEITNNFSFTNGVGASFTGFSTPNVNVTSSFTSNIFLGSSKNLEFSTRNSFGERSLKQTRAKLGKQTRSSQRRQRHTRLSNEVNLQSIQESPECCSPMDFSHYCSTDCGSTSANTSVSSVGKDEDAVQNTTGKLSEINFLSSSATSFAQVDAPTKQRPHQKKYRMKTGCGLEFSTPKRRVNASLAHEHNNQERTKAADQEACDKWRTRGNQAYRNGDLSKAEVYYTTGINLTPCPETRGFCNEPLVLCYSNRAATRMALGRLREGLADCRMAAALDPNFVKADLRSGNCHLLLGELEDAFNDYNKCLESEDNVCLDRRIAIEAADGLQKAQKVADYLKLSAELLQQKSHESATKALGIIDDALSISCYCEKLLKMKGEALLLLWKHEEIVQLCEQTLDSAKKNFATAGVSDVTLDRYDCKNTLKLWRWNLMAKSYFHLGRLETALELLEKHEQLRSTLDMHGSGVEESLIHLAVTIRELLQCKNAGNEAFQCGRHTEAVEHYTSAISKSIGSRSFASVCFCNRAAAHQSLGEIVDAIGDCSIAIALNGSYPKALSRRATLHEMIRDYKQAADDLQRLISILEAQSADKGEKSSTPGRSTGGGVKDLRRACRRLSAINEKAKKERSLDLYLILGLKASDPASEVKKAYRKAALRHHPDKAAQIVARTESGPHGQQWKEIAELIHTDADRLFKMIGEAYAVLSDPTKRSKYDLEEEMWDDAGTSESYGSTGRWRSREPRKTWQEPRDTHRSSYPGW